MSKFVAIVKTHGDLGTEHMPHEWPAHCEEFETHEEALAAHPDKPVLTAEQYHHFSRGLAMAHRHLPKPRLKKPWWKVW